VAQDTVVNPSTAASADLSVYLPALHRAGHADALHPIIPPGARLTKGSKLTTDQLGKLPGRYSADGDGGWFGYPWQREAIRPADLHYSLKHGGGLGVATRLHPFIDCDVIDERLGLLVEQVVREALNAASAPRRVGRAPKWAMPFRPDGSPSRKLQIKLGRDGESVGIIEILGDGNQIVLAGLHPKTLQPYTWHAADGRVGGLELLAEVPAAQLSPISLQIITDRLLPALVEQLAPLHVTATLAGSGSATAKRGEADRAPSLDDVCALMAVLPNELDYDPWVNVGFALYGATGGEGLDLWLEWSAKSPKDSPEKSRDKWESFSSTGLGWEALQGMARAAGVNTAPLAFTADADATPPATDDVPPYVAAFNSRYALVRRMANTVLHVTADGPEFIPIEHWRTLTATEKVDGKPISGLWLAHPARRIFRQVTMDPASPTYSPILVSGDLPDFNVWPGFAVEPSEQRSCDLFLAHLQDVVCSGNAALYQWVLQWLAAVVQAPERLTGTALVLRGPMGSGKSYVGEVMGRLLGTGLYSKVSKPEELTGRFNSHHQGKILLQVEEGFFAGNRAAVGALKHMITSDRVRIEGKFRDSYEIPNFCRLLITSNEEWVIPAGWSERRFTVIDISGAQKDDWEYHAAMRAQMANGGVANLLHVLLNTPLDFKLLSRPVNTAALRDQQLASMDADQRWLYDLLISGSFPEGRVEADLLYRLYAQFLRDHSAGRRADREAMGKLLHRLGAKKIRPRGIQGRTYVYQFPPLTECRVAFAEGLALPPEWEAPHAWPTDEEVTR
jgi:Family of unknown function (DUF5906)/Primase C terminal 2 (PriCT-2)